jgi:hypothetical protein
MKEVKTKIAQAYRIPFSFLSTYYKKLELCSTAGLTCGVVLKHMRICRTEHCDMANWLFEWICHV